MSWPLKINWEGYATKPGVKPGAPLCLQRAIRICEMQCPICLDMLCADVRQQFAVRIKCMCKSMWHAKCFEEYAQQNMRPTSSAWSTILCPLARHEIRVNRAAPLSSRPPSDVSRPIPLAPLVKMVLESGKNESRTRLIAAHREIRKETRRETRHAAAQAAQAPLSVRGEQNFLAALYGTLLPEVLIDRVGSYSLWWYRAGTESMEMGYYGDDTIEPWRSPDDRTVNPPHRVLSTKVQLRFKFNQGVRVDWDQFRAALRQTLGCRCSKPWKYKMATFRVVKGKDDDATVTQWTALQGAGQIHHKDTWVLTLDLHDTITRCKNSGAIDDAAVRTQIMLTRTNRGTRGTREDTREDTLGEPAQEADVHYVVSHAVDDLHEMVLLPLCGSLALLHPCPSLTNNQGRNEEHSKFNCFAYIQNDRQNHVASTVGGVCNQTGSDREKRATCNTHLRDALPYVPRNAVRRCKAAICCENKLYVQAEHVA